MVLNVANDSIEDSHAPEDPAAKERLLAEIRKTALGRHLLEDLERRNVTLVVTRDMSVANTETSVAGGYWNPLRRRIMLSAEAPLAKQLHYFAHETRHSAQHEVDMSFKNAAEILHPAHFLLRNRLHEMDADAFAVFFLANHAIEAKSTHFDALSQTESAPKLFGIFSLFDEKIDRSGMYRVFLESWKEHGKDMARAMRDAAAALFDEPLINKYYDARCVRLWNESIFPKMVDAAKAPDSYAARSLRKVFKAFHDKKAKTPEQDMLEHAQAYSKIYGEAGSPAYLAGVYDKVFPFLATDATGADRIWISEMPALTDRFNDASDYFIREIPEARAKKKTGRKARPRKAAA